MPLTSTRAPTGSAGGGVGVAPAQPHASGAVVITSIRAIVVRNIRSSFGRSFAGGAGDVARPRSRAAPPPGFGNPLAGPRTAAGAPYGRRSEKEEFDRRRGLLRATSLPPTPGARTTPRLRRRR